MEAVLELGRHLDEVVVIQLDVPLILILGSDVYSPISHAKVENSSAVEVMADAEGLENEGALETCTDVDDGVIGQ
jgi:hypothetical protein